MCDRFSLPIKNIMNSEEENQQFERQKPLYQDANFQIICAVSLMAVLGVASVGPAFPYLAEALKVNPKNNGLLVTVFTLPAVILGPVIGVWGVKCLWIWCV